MQSAVAWSPLLPLGPSSRCPSSTSGRQRMTTLVMFSPAKTQHVCRPDEFDRFEPNGAAKPSAATIPDLNVLVHAANRQPPLGVP